jgi:dipeptidase E
MPTRRHLLLLSSSRTAGTRYLEHAHAYLRSFLETRARSVVFVAYARVGRNYDEYTERVRTNFAALGYEVIGLHGSADPVQTLTAAEALMIGGGNTYHLLRELHAHNLLTVIRQRVTAGMPYIGWSAGTNVACPTICTTNDMPVVWPERCEALNLISFQINAHYTDAHVPGHQGETRAERLQEFTLTNPDMPVVGLREGSALRIEGDSIQLLGPHAARIFIQDTIHEIASGDALESLLRKPVPASPIPAPG